MPLQVQNNIVVNEDGTPADYFVFSTKEKVGLPNYSNVEFFASISRYIDPENIEEGKREVIEQVEQVLASERESLLETLSS